MPRGAKPGSQQERGRVTRERLLDATLATLAERGYAGTSLPEICRRADVSRGAQLHHFPEKEQLLCAAIERLMERRHQELRAVLRDLPRERRFDAFVDELWRIYAGDAFYVFLEVAIAARHEPALRRTLQAVNERFYDDANATLRELYGIEAAPPETVLVLARFVTSFMDGLATNRLLDDDDRLSRKTLDVFRELLRGLAPPTLGDEP